MLTRLVVWITFRSARLSFVGKTYKEKKYVVIILGVCIMMSEICCDNPGSMYYDVRIRLFNSLRTNHLTTLQVLMGGGGGIVPLIFNLLYNALVLI